MIAPARAWLRIWVVVLALLAGVRPAWAQNEEPGVQDPLTAPAERPPVTPTVQVHRLDLGLSFYDAFDRVSVTDVRRVFTSEPLLENQVGYTGGTAAMTYSYTGKENTFSGAGGTGLRYYSATENSLYPSDFYGGFNFSNRVSRRVRIQASETLTVSPYYTFGNAPITGDLSQLIAPQFDQAVNRVNAVTSDTTAGVTWTLTRKSSFTAGYRFDYVDADAAYHVHTMGVNGSYQYQKSRYMTLRAGYGFYRSQLPGQAVPYYDTHNIDGGIGYRRPLSFSRRSTLGFNVGSTLITDGARRDFYVTGDASLTYQLSQFWALTTIYNRSVSRMGGLASPYVTDLGSVSVGGLVTRRLSLAGSGSFSRGNTAVASQNAYDAAYATGRVGYSITRFIPVYAEYIYYFYRFDTSTGLAVNFPMNVNRHGLRAGLSYSIPLVGRRPGLR